MKETLFHGSDHIIATPEFGAGKLYNDYGLGLYCTREHDLAGEWAVSRDRDGVINEYLLDMEGMSILNLNGEDYCILDWLELLLENRTFDVQSDFAAEAVRYIHDNYGADYDDYDMIIGYRADDSYFSFAQDFLNNAISLATLEKAMRLGELGEQVVLKSRRSFERIEHVRADKAESSVYYPNKEKRDEQARRRYREMKNEPWQKGHTYIMQLMDREMKRDDLLIR